MHACGQIQKSRTEIKHTRCHKFLASRLRYYPNTDASFNIEKNPGAETTANSKKTRFVSNVNTDSDLTCFYQNVRSLKASGKLSHFQDIVLTNHFDIIALTETWLNHSVTNHEILPHSYTIYRKDRDSG